MALFLVVRHPDNPDQSYTNAWDPTRRLLQAITAPREVTEVLRTEKQRHNRIYIHRCAWGPALPRVTCSVLAGDIQPIDTRGKEFLVIFSDPRQLDFAPPIHPHEGQSYYSAPVPEGHDQRT